MVFQSHGQAVGRGSCESGGADQTREGLSGMSTWVTWAKPPRWSASTTALTTAGGEPMAPASPQPFTPKGLCVQGVWQEWSTA